MSRPILIMTCGYPRSGKSTFASAYAELHGAPIVCPDDIRHVLHGTPYRVEAEPHVWATARLATAALLRRHDEVILDATSVARSARDSFRDKPASIEQVRRWRVLVVHFDVSADECRQRVLSGDADSHETVALIGAIKRMSEQMESPLPDHELVVTYRPTESIPELCDRVRSAASAARDL